MSRRKRPQGHVNHERWLVSYADFITLLFAFFVVLYSSSQVDNRKVGKLAAAIQVAFERLGMFAPNGSRLSALAEPGVLSNSKAEVLPKALQRSGNSAASFDGNMPKRRAEAIAGIRKRLELSLADELSRGELRLRTTPEGVIISLQDLAFFETGSAAVRRASYAALHRIASVLSSTNCSIRIEGHTDNVPIHTRLYPSNWELSTARATSIVRDFIEREAMDPARLSGAGYAEFHPIADNSGAEGRQLNRRVDLVVVPPVGSAIDLGAFRPAGGDAVSGYMAESSQRH